MTLTRWYVTALTLAVMIGFAQPTWAQQQTGSISGRAEDGSGAALPGVTVSITSDNLIGGARSAVTDGQGVYRFTLLPGGKFTVKRSEEHSSELQSQANLVCCLSLDK